MTRHRKHRRLSKARLRTGKKIVKHKLQAGRTGRMHTKKLKTLKRPKKSKRASTYVIKISFHPNRYPDFTIYEYGKRLS